jgi:two-component SAPR family response regulator
VLRFRTAIEAMTGLIKARPDVAVMELPLAGSTLEELARAVRVANPRADLVVVGSSSAEEEVRARAQNVVFYAVRPVEAETLREVVLTACAAVARGGVNA